MNLSLTKRILSTLAIALLIVMIPQLARAQLYPTKPITIVVPFSPGSGTDQVARAMGQVISQELHGATIIIDNRPGASGMIAAQMAAHSSPDGYTLFMTTNTTQAANQYLFKKMSYDPAADFAPIAALARGAMVLTVSSSSPLKTVAEFTKAARAKPTSFGAGNSSSRVAAELFKQATGANLLYIPYKANPQSIVDLMGGQIDVMFADTATALPLIKTGKLRALGYTGLQRSAALPDVPTLDESGIKGFELSYWVAVYAPRGTPAEIIDKLNGAFTKAVHNKLVESVYSNAVLEPFTTTPDGLALYQRMETQKWGRIIKAAGIEPE